MEDYPPEMQHFIEHEGIEILHYRMEGNKEPFVEINSDDITHALVKLLDERSHPGKPAVLGFRERLILILTALLLFPSPYSLSQRQGRV